jgi:alpha-1,2-mannosyltransferase
MTPRLRWLVVLALVVIAAVAYIARIQYEMIDFITWRQSALRALQAEPLYRPEDGHYQFKYLPMFAVVMASLGALSQDVGKLIWYAISVAFLAALLRWSVVALPDRRLSQLTLIVITVILMAKFYVHELLLGQTNLLLGVLLVGALLAVQRDRALSAGALIGAAVFVKPYALILIPWLVVARGWRATAMAASVVAAGLVLPAAVYGWTGNLDLLRGWLRTVTDSTAPNLLGNDNVSIAAMWAKWLGPGSSATVLTLVTLASIGGLLIVSWRRRRGLAEPEYLEYGLLMLLIPLVSPQGWDYLLLLATPAVVCLMDRWREFPRLWQWGLGIALALMGLSSFDLMGRTLYGRFMSLSIVSVCALIVAVGLIQARRLRLA